jgi:hypothetical protein
MKRTGDPAPSRANIKDESACVHCRRRARGRAHGLCNTCYYTPDVRALYGEAQSSKRRGVEDGYGHRPLPEDTTTAIPGTPEKVAILTQRAELGLSLFHPDDGPSFGDDD